MDHRTGETCWHEMTDYDESVYVYSGSRKANSLDPIIKNMSELVLRTVVDLLLLFK